MKERAVRRADVDHDTEPLGLGDGDQFAPERQRLGLGKAWQDQRLGFGDQFGSVIHPGPPRVRCPSASSRPARGKARRGKARGKQRLTRPLPRVASDF